MEYTPHVEDLSDVELPSDILELSELLAERTHEVWAEARMREGWHFGPERNDGMKLHPCLVPYAELPESEKEYDRNTAMETLRYIVSLGYKIERR